MDTADRWFSVEEIAQYLGVSKESIYRWLERGVIPANKVGKQWRFKTTEVDDWVKRGDASENHRSLKSDSVKIDDRPLFRRGVAHD